MKAPKFSGRPLNRQGNKGEYLLEEYPFRVRVYKTASGGWRGLLEVVFYGLHGEYAEAHGVSAEECSSKLEQRARQAHRYLGMLLGVSSAEIPTECSSGPPARPTSLPG